MSEQIVDPKKAAAITDQARLELEALKGDWVKVKEFVSTFVKRRLVPKTSVTEIVELVYSWTEGDESEDMMQYLTWLDKLSDGKMFLEIMRSKALRRLANFHEKAGDIQTAKMMLQDLQVETFTSLSYKEKVEYILEQMRIVFLAEDFVRLQIISKKISEKVLETDEYVEERRSYYGLMIHYCIYEKLYAEAADCAMKSMSADEKNEMLLWDATLLAFLGDQDERETETLNKVRERTEDQTLQRIIDEFLGKDIADECRELDPSETPSRLFKTGPFGDPKDRREVLASKLLQRDLLVVAQLFVKVTFIDLEDLLKTSQDNIEQEVVELVKSGKSKAMINRPAKTIMFRPLPTLTEVATSAAEGLRYSLNLLETVHNQIRMEEMLAVK